MSSLAGKVAVVVGASSGMGRATVVALADAGAKVVAAARRTERLNALRNELSARGQTIEVCVTDAQNAADVEGLVEFSVRHFGRIDLLVYATGTNIPERSINVLNAETWDMMIATNLTGAFHCTKAVLPVMRNQGNGLIVYLSSGAVQMPDVSGVAYQATKHALRGLAHGTRVEEKRNGIRTSIIFPGLCDTEILSRRPVPTPPEVVEKALQPEDVAQAVVFLAQLDPRAVVPEMQLFPSRL